MSFFELQFKFQLLALATCFAFLAIMTLCAIWSTSVIRTKMLPETPLVWSVGLSLFATSAVFCIGNVEPIEELIILIIGHAIAWNLIQKKRVVA